MPTPILGLYQVPANSPEYQGGASQLALLAATLNVLDQKFAVAVQTTSGPLGSGSPPTSVLQGNVGINAAGALAITLIAPVAGLPALGGMDGFELEIWDETGKAHTITTPAGALNTNKRTITFNGTIGSFVQLVARNGAWWVMGSGGVALT